MRCSIKYVLGSSCSKLKFSCQSFDIVNDSPRCNRRRGDRLTITNLVSKRGTKNQRTVYCNDEGPSIVSEADIKVEFRSNGDDEAGGAQCSVECQESSETEEESGEKETQTEGKIVVGKKYFIIGNEIKSNKMSPLLFSTTPQSSGKSYLS